MSYVDDEGPRNRSGPLCNLCSLLLCFFFWMFFGSPFCQTTPVMYKKTVRMHGNRDLPRQKGT